MKMLWYTSPSASIPPDRYRPRSKLTTKKAPDWDPSLYILAHEADTVSGTRAVSVVLVLMFFLIRPTLGVERLELQNHTLVSSDGDDGVGSSVKALQNLDFPIY